MKRLTLVTILLVMLVLVLVSSCLVGFAKEKVITFARLEDISYLDPYDQQDISSYIINYLIYDRLVDFNPETGIGFVPALATEWDISPDGREYTFKLRKGVKFHNGEPFNAECVKVSLERFLNEKLRRGSIWEGLKEVGVVDDYTVIVRFNNPNVLCLTNLIGTPILPSKAFTEKGTTLFDNPIGTGAFTWSHWKRGQEIVVEKNPDYWGKPAYIDKLIYLPIIEDSTRVAGVLTGEIDIGDSMPADQVSRVESNPNLEVVRTLSWDQIFLGLKVDKPPFTDIKFRQAINLALDRENIVKYVLNGGRAATGILPKGVFGFDDKLVPVKRDVEKAKQLVKESIYDGREIELIAPVGWYAKTKDVVQAIQAELMEIGVKVNVNTIESGVFIEKMYAGDYDIHLCGWAHSGDVDFFIYNRIGNDALASGYVNEELNKMIEDQRKEVDSEKRIEMLRKIENIVNIELAPIIFVYQMEQLYFQQKGITGARYYGSKAPDLRYVHYKE